MSDHSAKKFSIGLLLLGLLAVMLAGGYWWLAARHRNQNGVYGAIAMSQSSLDFGSSWGYGDPLDAYKRSLEECNARVKSADCVVRLSLAGTCGALAVSASRGQSFVVTDVEKNLAGAFALAQCQAAGADDCVVSQNFCGNGS